MTPIFLKSNLETIFSCPSLITSAIWVPFFLETVRILMISETELNVRVMLLALFENRCSQILPSRKKLEAYSSLILSILLYGSECWCLSENLLHVLRLFHHACIRSMCRVNLSHTFKHRIST